MPRSGQAFPVDDAWRAAVVDALRVQGLTQGELARRAGCGRTAISNLVQGVVRQSPLVPDIHAALGWPAPMPPLASVDAPELSAIYDKLDDTSRAMLLERARTLLELHKKR